MSLDIKLARQVLADALKGEFLAAPAVFLRNWVPQLLQELEDEKHRRSQAEASLWHAVYRTHKHKPDCCGGCEQVEQTINKSLEVIDGREHEHYGI